MPDGFHEQHHKTEITVHHVFHLDDETRCLLYHLFGDRADAAIKAEIERLKASSDKLKQAVDAAGDVSVA